MLTRVQKQRAGQPVTPSCPCLPCLLPILCCGLVNSRPLLRDPAALGLPVLVENRPQRLIQVLAVLQERLAKDAFLHGADLPQRAVAAAVADRRARLEPVHADRLEREADDQQFAPSWNTPVPQNGDPIAKPHSAVPNPGSSSRSWKMPIAVSSPVSVTAKHA